MRRLVFTSVVNTCNNEIVYCILQSYMHYCINYNTGFMWFKKVHWFKHILLHNLYTYAIQHYKTFVPFYTYDIGKKCKHYQIC